ncbi:hypothetical protein ABT158_47645 [Nonomuraea sp. NPDC001636]|uniref:hypothetical protein n=1 Tax=Nonomuraea sp. NPDC001636 TaxID=3154391 RepID=UPI00331A511E
MAGTDLAPCQVCGEPLDACTEQRRLTFERCCPACRTRATHMAAEHQAGNDDGSRSRADLALIRTLVDIDDGHLSLWISGRFFDQHTGRPLDPPQIDVMPDRQPYHGVPDPDGAWWSTLVDRGWLEMPTPGTHPMRYRVSETGQAALQAARRDGTVRPRPPLAGGRGTPANNPLPPEG